MRASRVIKVPLNFGSNFSIRLGGKARLNAEALDIDRLSPRSLLMRKLALVVVGEIEICLQTVHGKLGLVGFFQILHMVNVFVQLFVVVPQHH